MNLLKWPGGKGKLAPMLLRHVLPAGRPVPLYVEPFVGGGAFARAAATVLPPTTMRLADSNQRLITTHEAVAFTPAAVAAWLDEADYRNTPENYATMRAALNVGPPTAEAIAALMLWLNRACFNGLYRENRAGAFNVPRGKADEVAWGDPLAWLTEWNAPFVPHRVEYVCGDWTVAFDPNPTPAEVAGAAVYLDPPYMPEPGTKQFTTYVAGGFGLAEHRALAEVGRRWAAAGARVVLSNALHEGTRGVYGEGWNLVETLEVKRAIGGHVDRRNNAPEGVWVCGQ